MNRPILLIVRGPLAVGKSTVAAALQESFHPCALIRVDMLRRMISDNDLSHRHLVLAKQNACLLARQFAAEGYSVIIESVFQEDRYIELVARELRPLGTALYLVTLEASLEVLCARDAQKTAPNGKRVEAVYRFLAASGARAGLRIDTSQLTVSEVCDAILADLERGEGLIPQVPLGKTEGRG